MLILIPEQQHGLGTTCWPSTSSSTQCTASTLDLQAAHVSAGPACEPEPKIHFGKVCMHAGGVSTQLCHVAAVSAAAPLQYINMDQSGKPSTAGAAHDAERVINKHLASPPPAHHPMSITETMSPNKKTLNFHAGARSRLDWCCCCYTTAQSHKLVVPAANCVWMSLQYS
jgi:hypothetical protein